MQEQNYAFRSFCNRCNQRRLLVDTKTPADSKWLPRIGNWICTGHKAHGTKRLASEELIHEWNNKRVNLGNISGQSNGVMEIECAPIATIIIMHLDQNAIGVKLIKKLLSQSMLFSLVAICKFVEALISGNYE